MAFSPSFVAWNPLPQGARGAWSAASASVRPVRGTVFSILEKSAEAWAGRRALVFSEAPVSKRRGERRVD